MNAIVIKKSFGGIYLNGYLVAPLSKVELLRVCQEFGLNLSEHSVDNSESTFGTEVSFANEKFGLNLSYKNEDIEFAWFSWVGGNVGGKGCDVNEKELIADKNRLCKILMNNLGVIPAKSKFNSDVFVFDWGNISVSAALNSSIVSFGLFWKGRRVQRSD